MAQQRSKPWRGVQRHTLETGLLCASTLRLCWLLGRSGAPDASLQALGLGALCGLALLLEFGEKALSLPYALRKSESSGLAEGALAVPSVLAALACAVPQGPWLYWLQATLAAGFAMLAFLQLQGVRSQDKHKGHKQQVAATAASEAPTATPARTMHSTENVHTASRPARSGHTALKHAIDRQTTAQKAETASPDGAQAGATMTATAATAAAARGAVLAGPLRQHFIACCICMVAVVLLPQQGQFMAPTTLDSLPQPQLLASFSPSRLQQLLASARLLLLVAATPAVYHWGMTHMHSCFSVGEGMLLAQGASLTLVAAAGKLRMLPAFMPAALSLTAAATAAATGQSAQGVGAKQHMAAGATEVPAFVLLLCGSVLCLCWLLWLALRQYKAVSGRTGSSSTSSRSQSSISVSWSHTKIKSTSSRNQTRSSVSSGWAVPWLGTAVAAAAVAIPAAVIVCLAAWTLLAFLPGTPLRARVLLLWALVLAVSLQVMHLVAHRTNVPQIILRKGYHLLAMALFLPVFFWDGPMLAVSLAVAFAALAAVEVVRCAQVPRLGAAVQRFMQDFTDERDAGAIYVTHFTLLLGLALPVWVTLALPATSAQPQAAMTSLSQSTAAAAALRSIQSAGGGSTENLLTSPSIRSAALASLPGLQGSLDNSSGAVGGPTLLAVLAGLSGLMAVGVGDTAASVMGRLVGKRPIHIGSKKTVEGTLAGICCTLMSWWLVLRAVGAGEAGVVLSGQQWLWLVVNTAGAGLLEACTSQLDNIMIPMYYLAHMLLMDIR